MRYLLKFKKQGDMIYISHLDLQRIFKRTLRRIGVKLKYSKGFNPHPKMSFVQPLSLGYSSTAEYLEFETEENLGFLEQMIESINANIPNGIVLTALKELPSKGKTMASHVACARYRIKVPYFDDAEERVDSFLKESSIPMTKESKKKGKVEVDIRSMILAMAVERIDDKFITLTCFVDTGSNSNLNPEALIVRFYEYNGIPCDKSKLDIERTALFGSKDGEISDISDII